MNNRYYIQQKIIGALMVLIGLISGVLSDGDFTVSLLTVPLGLYSLFTKDIIIK